MDTPGDTFHNNGIVKVLDSSVPEAFKTWPGRVLGHLV